MEIDIGNYGSIRRKKEQCGTRGDTRDLVCASAVVQVGASGLRECMKYEVVEMTIDSDCMHRGGILSVLS